MPFLRPAFIVTQLVPKPQAKIGEVAYTPRIQQVQILIPQVLPGHLSKMFSAMRAALRHCDGYLVEP